MKLLSYAPMLGELFDRLSFDMKFEVVFEWIRLSMNLTLS